MSVLFTINLLGESENYMNSKIKTKEELVKESQELRQELRTLQASNEKDLVEHREAEKNLRLSEELYRGLFDNMLNGFAYCKMIYNQEQPQDFIFLNVNLAFEIQTGLKNVIGKKASEVIPDIQKTDFPLIQLYGRVALTGIPENFEMFVKALNMWFAVSVYSTEKEYFAAIFDVITKRKQAVMELRESEEKFKALFENAKDGIILLTDKGSLVAVNDAFARIHGYTVDEMVKMNLNDLNTSESSRLSPVRMQKIMEGESMTFEVEHFCKNGQTIPIEVSASLVTIGGRKYLLGFNRDIIARKKAENSLYESESRFRTLIEQSPIAIIISRVGIGLYANQKCLQLFGLQKIEQFIGIPIFSILAPQFQEDSKKRIHLRSLGLPVPEEFESVGQRIDGSQFPLQVTVKEVKLSDGNANIAFISDITERKQVMEELILAKQQAEESNRLKSTFLANMSHEIRTPMNGILGFAELLKEPQLTGMEQQKYISIIEISGKRMLNIINDIVSISKIESGQMEISINETNINEQIEFIYNFFKPEYEKKGLQLLVKNIPPSKVNLIKTDSEKLYAILTNLVGNALKYTNHGFIEFGVEKKGDFLEFFVKDTGKGIPENQREIIFERFRQGNDLITKPYEGTGLGLSISKAYVEMLGGKIWVASELGRGSTFYFTIPYNVDAESKSTIAKGTANTEADHQVKNLKILIAEDDESSVLFLSRSLKAYCNEILTAGTGVEAVKACRNRPDLDLVLMDVRMSDMDGYTATRQIRQFNKDIIIIAQSAYVMAGDREKAIKAGCTDYISKPIRIDVLKELIRKHFNNK